MHRVSSLGSTSGSVRGRREKRLTYVLNDANDSRHCSGINALAVSQGSGPDGNDFLFSGSRDGTIKRWELDNDTAICSATFESHVDWVNDMVLTGKTLVSCSSDTTLKTWRPFTDGVCSRTLRQHSDYVTCLAAAAKNSHVVASGGLGREVFIWDIEAAMSPVSRAPETADEDVSNGILNPGSSGIPSTNVRSPNSVNNNTSLHPPIVQGYVPIAAKGHKESVYALAMNDAGTILVSGGTEKVVRVWDARSGSKQMKLRGHTDNVRALLLDSSGRMCLSGSSDSVIRLWDLGQQRCVHTYAVHTDSVWALASTPNFTHVYSGGRDLSLYLTDLTTRESVLLCMEGHPILQLALQDDWIWAATTDSSIHKWPAERQHPQKIFQKGSSFLAGNLSFTRARACLEGSTPAPVHTHPSFTIQGSPGIVQHEILNDRRHVLTKDAEGNVKLWEITRGAVIEDYGKVAFDEKKEELFERVSIPAWFTMDTRLGSMSIHLEPPQCFSAEMYAVDLNIPGASEEQKVNLAQETLRGLLSHWLMKRKERGTPQVNSDTPAGQDNAQRNHILARPDVHNETENYNSGVHSAFQFSTVSPPSIITEGSQGGPWRKKVTDLDGTEDEKDLPWWCIDCILNNRLPARENAKCSFYLHPYEGTTAQVLTQGKLSAPRILRIQKVINYVLEKLVPDRTMDVSNSETPYSVNDPLLRSNVRPWQPKPKPSVEILCNNQVLPPDMSLATVRAYVWKKPDDLYLYYRVLPK
eukprot:TRINITY_DN2397_c0_g1_i1.p1 TRINITY_DN2397_c0_g1~~TRINITY_DN2397_c0_g1_i1.p1  ORF type:complete len:753 (+),score=154.85 TRINITY_DN2397_c0_g1_i1:499-2757(+)